jgi:micrococcal nuclease
MPGLRQGLFSRSLGGLAAILAAALFMATWGGFWGDAGRGSKGSPSEATPPLRDRVARVVDGDTFRLASGDDVRLVGIDCPEKGEPYCDEATRFAEGIALSRDVRIEFDKERRDRYGRLLAYVFVTNAGGRETFVNERLVREGLAFCFEVSPNTRHSERLRAAQDAARREKTGVWANALAGAAGEVVASSSGRATGRRFHRPDCPSVRSIKSPLRLASRAAALDAGLSPCRQCKP